MSLLLLVIAFIAHLANAPFSAAFAFVGYMVWSEKNSFCVFDFVLLLLMVAEFPIVPTIWLLYKLADLPLHNQNSNVA